VKSGAVLLTALLVAGCVAMTPGELDAARRGREDARIDVERGRPRTAYVGFLLDEDSPLDVDTGFVKFSVGCCKSHERLAYREAYESVVASARRAGRFDGRTLERKATTREAVAARLAAVGGGAEVKMGGPGLESPDGRFHVEAAPASGVYGVALWSTDKGSGGRDELRRLGGDRVVAAFDETGDVLYVRDSAVGAYATFDLPTALPLQVFSDRGAR
jgi:hypothetical protein